MKRGDLTMDKTEEQDVAFLTSIIKQICDYAIANNMKPNETLKDVSESILALLEISSFDGWG